MKMKVDKKPFAMAGAALLVASFALTGSSAAGAVPQAAASVDNCKASSVLLNKAAKDGCAVEIDMNVEESISLRVQAPSGNVAAIVPNPGGVSESATTAALVRTNGARGFVLKMESINLDSDTGANCQVASEMCDISNGLKIKASGISAADSDHGNSDYTDEAKWGYRVLNSDKADGDNSAALVPGQTTYTSLTSDDGTTVNNSVRGATANGYSYIHFGAAVSPTTPAAAYAGRVVLTALPVA